MNLFEDYLEEITTRKKQGLNAKPIDSGDLAREIIAHVKAKNSTHPVSYTHLTLPTTSSV